MRYAVIALVALAVLLVAAYWYSTGGVPDRAPAAWLTERPIAHRGQWTEGPERPENSVAAFEEAVRNGYAVELDVQLSADGQVVIFHDKDLERMTGAPGLVSERSLEQLKKLRLHGGAETIPTLDEALSVVSGRVPVFVEIKNSGDVGRLEDDVAARLAAYEGEAAVMSFNPFSVGRVASAEPGIPRGQLSSALRGEGLAFYEVFLLSNLLMNWTSKPDFIAYDLEELPTLGTRLQRTRGRPLLGWTAQSAEDRATAKELCDAVICNPKALPSQE